MVHPSQFDCGILVVRVSAIERSPPAFCCYVRKLKYAVINTTSKSMTPIAQRKKPKGGSGITDLLVLFAFAIEAEPEMDGLVPIQAPPKLRMQHCRRDSLADSEAAVRFGNKRSL
jgi:hypothetical protein